MSDDLDPVEFAALSLADQMFLFAADALEPDERSELQRRLDDGDESAWAALREAEGLMGQLPDALEPISPPATSEATLIERAQASAGPVAVSAPVDLASRRVSRQPWVRALALAAGISLVVLSSLAWVQRERAHQHALDRVAADLATQAKELETLRAEAADRLAERDQALAQAERLAADLSVAEEMASTLEAAAASLVERDLPSPSAGEGPALEAEILKLRDQVLTLETAIATRDARPVPGDPQTTPDAGVPNPTLQSDLAAARDALALVRAPDVGIVDLLPPNPGPPSSASVFWDRGLKHCYLHARALPPTQNEERYALWLEYDGGKLVRISDFQVDGRGDAEFFEDLPQGQGEIRRTFVTLESTADAAKPSDRIVLNELALDRSGNQAPNSRRRYRRRTL